MHPDQMNLIDTAVLAIIGISLVIGLWRGFLRELMSLCVWIFCVVAAVVLSPLLSSYIDVVSQPVARLALCFIGILIAAYILGMLLRFAFMKMAGDEVTFPGRLLGGLFGIVRGAIIVCVLVFILSFTSLHTSNEWKTSRAVPIADGIDRGLLAMMPDDAGAHLQSLVTPVAPLARAAGVSGAHSQRNASEHPASDTGAF